MINSSEFLAVSSLLILFNIIFFVIQNKTKLHIIINFLIALSGSAFTSGIFGYIVGVLLFNLDRSIDLSMNNIRDLVLMLGAGPAAITNTISLLLIRKSTRLQNADEQNIINEEY